jgi:hypothetical protein
VIVLYSLFLSLLVLIRTGKCLESVMLPPIGLWEVLVSDCGPLSEQFLCSGVSDITEVVFYLGHSLAIFGYLFDGPERNRIFSEGSKIFFTFNRDSKVILVCLSLVIDLLSDDLDVLLDVFKLKDSDLLFTLSRHDV